MSKMSGSDFDKISGDGSGLDQTFLGAENIRPDLCGHTSASLTLKSTTVLLQLF